MLSERLSESLEDYLEAIAELTEIEGHAHTKEIARRLNVKMPSVTAALKQLAQLGYIEYNTHFPVELTAAGRVVAERVCRHHNVLRQFFAGVLGLPADIASETACRMEHLVDEETIERFVLFSEAIAHRQEAEKLRVFLTDAMQQEKLNAHLLSDLPIGAKVTVSFIGRNVNDCCLSLGDSITVGAYTLDHTQFSVEKGDKLIFIPAEHAENIWCLNI